MRAVGAGRIALQHALDEAHRLEVLAPVEGRAQAQARDDVRHGDLRRGLALMLAPDRVLGGHLLDGEVRVDGGADGGEARAVLAQALEELDDEARVEVRRQGRGHAVARGVDPRPRRRRPRGRRRARFERLLRQPAQVLDEGELQHARPGPQLADGQRGHRLVAVHEAHELLPVQAAVAVTDQLHGHGVDAGVARELARGELGQLAVVAGREVPADVPGSRRPRDGSCRGATPPRG